MKTYRIEFWVDTDYELLNKECIVIANSEKEAIYNFKQWVHSRCKDLPCQWFIKDEEGKIKVTEIEAEGFGIVSQNLFKKRIKR